MDNITQWHMFKCKSGEILFYYNIVTGEHRWASGADMMHCIAEKEQGALVTPQAALENSVAMTQFKTITTQTDDSGPLQETYHEPTSKPPNTSNTNPEVIGSSTSSSGKDTAKQHVKTSTVVSLLTDIISILNNDHVYTSSGIFSGEPRIVLERDTQSNSEEQVNRTETSSDEGIRVQSQTAQPEMELPEEAIELENIARTSAAEDLRNNTEVNVTLNIEDKRYEKSNDFDDVDRNEDDMPNATEGQGVPDNSGTGHENLEFQMLSNSSAADQDTYFLESPLQVFEYNQTESIYGSRVSLPAKRSVDLTDIINDKDDANGVTGSYGQTRRMPKVICAWSESDNLPTMVGRAGDNLPSMVGRAADNLPSMVGRAGGNLPTMVSRAGNNLPSMVGRARDSHPSTVGREGDNLPSMVDRAGDNLPSMVGRARDNLPSMVGRAGDNLPSMVGRARDNLPTMVGRAGVNQPPMVGRAGEKSNKSTHSTSVAMIPASTNQGSFTSRTSGISASMVTGGQEGTNKLTYRTSVAGIPGSRNQESIKSHISGVSASMVTGGHERTNKLTNRTSVAGVPASANQELFKPCSSGISASMVSRGQESTNKPTHNTSVVGIPASAYQESFNKSHSSGVSASMVAKGQDGTNKPTYRTSVTGIPGSANQGPFKPCSSAVSASMVARGGEGLNKPTYGTSVPGIPSSTNQESSKPCSSGASIANDQAPQQQDIPGQRGRLWQKAIPVVSLRCSVCGLHCKSAGELTSHLRFHAGKTKTCPVCNRLYGSYTGLVFHLRTHSGDRPYVCELCNKTFSHPSARAAHIRTHSKENTHRTPRS